MNDYRAYVMCDYCSIYHFGTDGMKWGRRRYQNEDGSYKPGAEGRYYDEVGGTGRPKGGVKPLKSSSGDSSVTRKVKNDYNKLDNQQFLQKYKIDKATYEKRVAKQGDPYKYRTDKKYRAEQNKTNRKETVDSVKHFVSSHKKEIAIGAAATTALIAGVVLYKSGALKKASSSNKPDISNVPRLTKHPNNPGGGGGAAKVVTNTVKKAANTPDFKVTPNSTKAAVEAVKKAAQSAPRANTQTITKGAEDLARATKNQQAEAQKIINAVDSGSDYVNQLLKENEEMLKKIRNGGV